MTSYKKTSLISSDSGQKHIIIIIVTRLDSTFEGFPFKSSFRTCTRIFRSCLSRVFIYITQNHSKVTHDLRGNFKKRQHRRACNEIYFAKI